MERSKHSATSITELRLDKWLWAARFYKTRGLARQAIDGGKIHCDGQRVKASKVIKPQCVITISQGYEEREIIVLALNDQRRPAKEAQTLYQETQESLDKRQKAQELRKLVGQPIRPPKKPDKHARKTLQHLKRFD
ncbi:MAG: S4 domain-containing protein [Pseudomonadota bacterium]